MVTHHLVDPMLPKPHDPVEDKAVLMHPLIPIDGRAYEPMPAPCLKPEASSSPMAYSMDMACQFAGSEAFFPPGGNGEPVGGYRNANMLEMSEGLGSTQAMPNSGAGRGQDELLGSIAREDVIGMLNLPPRAYFSTAVETPPEGALYFPGLGVDTTSAAIQSLLAQNQVDAGGLMNWSMVDAAGFSLEQQGAEEAEGATQQVKKRRVGRPPKDGRRRAISCSEVGTERRGSLEKRRRARRASKTKPNHALPATAPVTEFLNGIEHISFTYSVKGQNIRYLIRADVDAHPLDTIPLPFRRDNCLYPRAYCQANTYQGNRWEYESSCNILGWKLAWLNQEIIAGRRGLLQRAVDSYRNRCPEMRSRRVVRQEKLRNGTLRKRHSRGESKPGTGPEGARKLSLDSEGGWGEEAAGAVEGGPEAAAAAAEEFEEMMEESEEELEARDEKTDREIALAMEQATKEANERRAAASRHKRAQLLRIPKYMCFDAFQQRQPIRTRVRISLGDVRLTDIPEDFKRDNSVYPRALGPAEGDNATRRSYERVLNECGWKLAWLNRKKLAGNRALLQRTLDIYRTRFMEDRLRFNNQTQQSQPPPMQAPPKRASLPSVTATGLAGFVEEVDEARLGALRMTRRNSVPDQLMMGFRFHLGAQGAGDFFSSPVAPWLEGEEAATLSGLHLHKPATTGDIDETENMISYFSTKWSSSSPTSTALSASTSCLTPSSFSANGVEFWRNTEDLRGREGGGAEGSQGVLPSGGRNADLIM
ncbi:uncharacterized protein VTP21DRAFT_10983 [Calcarisporiella thermophila]|uniref:uncharacterized protein n=1 Tax=Calcarisporiella thermophila TaxID=911321 RepID=UPI003743B69E